MATAKNAPFAWLYVVASFFDACVSLYVFFYIPSTHFKSLVCVVSMRGSVVD